MNEKEAIDKLKSPELPDGLVMVDAETRREAIKALEKQIPCKPEEYIPDFPYNIFSTQKCAKCGAPVISKKISKYCSECGQRLDWGEEW